MAGTFLPKFRLAFETHFQSLPRCKKHQSLEGIWPQACQIIKERKASRTRELEIRRIATAMAVDYERMTLWKFSQVGSPSYTDTSIIRSARTCATETRQDFTDRQGNVSISWTPKRALRYTAPLENIVNLSAKGGFKARFFR